MAKFQRTRVDLLRQRLRAGDMRDKLTIYTITQTTDSGGPKTVRTELATIRAHVEPMSGREAFELHTLGAEKTYRIKTHHLKSVDPGDEADWTDRDGKARVLNFTDVSHWTAQKPYLEILATENRQPSAGT